MNENSISYEDDAYGSGPVYNQAITADKPVEEIVKPVYTTKTAKNGRTLYFKNGRLTAFTKIPEGVILVDTDTGAQVETVAPSVPKNDTVPVVTAEGRQCIYGDGAGEYERFVNGRAAYLCENHYSTMSLGRIVQQLREM